jgi:hypothetical protein
MLFRAAGATGYVFTLSHGRFHDKGIGWSGYIWPGTTVAVVPAIPQIVSFVITAYTRDKQKIVVRGQVQALLIADVAKNFFDFTVDRRTGGYHAKWDTLLQSAIIEAILTPIRDQALKLDVSSAITSQPLFESAVAESLASGKSVLATRGVRIETCSITLAEPADTDVSAAIGSKEREDLLSAADTARHERRLKAVENDRAIKTFEAETSLKLEQEKGKLVEEEGKNQIAAASSEAEATRISLEPLTNTEAGQLMAASLMVAAREGKLGSIAITTELLAAVNSGKGK